MDDITEFLDPRPVDEGYDVIFMNRDLQEKNFVAEFTNGYLSDFKVKDQSVPLEDITILGNVLNVPGVGGLVPGTRVIVDNKDYVLLLGWHTNISNQTIHSWFLRSLTEDAPDRTLYKEMIDKIEVVHFR